MISAARSQGHDKKQELWICMFKKGSGTLSVDWQDCVIACLSWSWIEGVRRTFDEVSFIQRIDRRLSILLSKLDEFALFVRSRLHETTLPFARDKYITTSGTLPARSERRLCVLNHAGAACTHALVVKGAMRAKQAHGRNVEAMFGRIKPRLANGRHIAIRIFELRGIGK